MCSRHMQGVYALGEELVWPVQEVVRKPILLQMYDQRAESQAKKPSWSQGPDLAGHFSTRKGL